MAGKAKYDKYKFYDDIMTYVNISLQNLFGAGDDYTIDDMLNWNVDNIIEESNASEETEEDNKVEITHTDFSLNLSINDLNVSVDNTSAIPIVRQY